MLGNGAIHRRDQLRYAIGFGGGSRHQCRVRDFTRHTLERYTELLWPHNVFTDFRAFRHAPDFVNGERLQNDVSDLAAYGAMFRVDGNAKQRFSHSG